MPLTSARTARDCPRWCTEVHDPDRRYFVHRGPAARVTLAEGQEPLELRAYQADDGRAADDPLVHLRLDSGQCTVIRVDEARLVASALLELTTQLVP